MPEWAGRGERYCSSASPGNNLPTRFHSSNVEVGDLSPGLPGAKSNAMPVHTAQLFALPFLPSFGIFHMVTWATRPPPPLRHRQCKIDICPFSAGFSSLHFFTGIHIVLMLRTLTRDRPLAARQADRAAIRICHPLPVALAGLFTDKRTWVSDTVLHRPNQGPQITFTRFLVSPPSDVVTG